MSLLNTFRSLPIAPFRPGTLNRWRSALKSPRPFLDLRSRAFLPAAAAAALLSALVFQLTFPAISSLPPKSDLAARRVREPMVAVAMEYPAILKSPIFAPDRAPDPREIAIAGGMAGYAVLGTAVAGDTATAIVRTPSGTVERVRPGEDLDGWKLISVTQRELTLERNNEHRILTVTQQPPVFVPPPAKPANSDDADDQSDQTDQTADDQNNGLSP